VVVLLWGGSYPAIKATQPFFPPVAFAAFRCAVAAVILGVVGLLTGGLRADLRPRDWGVVVLLGLLGNTLFHTLMVSAVHHTAPSHAAILVALSPVLAALLARLLFREPLGPRRLGGIALGFAGVAVIVTRGAQGPSSLLGDLLSLGASLSWALYTVVGKPVLTRATPLAVTTWAAIIGVIPMLPLGAPGLREVRWSALTPGRWLLIAYLSAGTIALANLLWYMALARTATARVVAFSFLIPLIATGIAVLAGQETLTPSLVLGAAAVLCGVAFAHRA
jgi:drug/metabolite transporter (DMT)-like permease